MFGRLSKVGRWYELVIQDKHVLGEFETEKKHSVLTGVRNQLPDEM